MNEDSGKPIDHNALLEELNQFRFWVLNSIEFRLNDLAKHV
jgi:hypothetical protein